ncbi:MAG: hypothetical protein JXB49_19705 [Bacteroidales bacterium]|nr:hypothetical protein [Bacteroidales bacterium]
MFIGKISVFSFLFISLPYGLYSQYPEYTWGMVKLTDEWEIGYIIEKDKNGYSMQSPYMPYELGRFEEKDICFPERFVMVEKDGNYYFGGMIFATGNGALVRYCYVKGFKDELIEDLKRISFIKYYYDLPVYESSIYKIGILEDTNSSGDYIIRYHGYGKKWEEPCMKELLELLQSDERSYAPVCRSYGDNYMQDDSIRIK